VTVRTAAETGSTPGGLELAAASVTAAVAGWATLVVVARGAGPSEYAAFAVLWSCYYGVAGILAGLQQEVTRTGTEPGPGRRLGRHSVAAFALGSLVSGAAVLLLGLAGAVPGGTAAALAGLLTGLVGLAGQVVRLGLLAADGRWLAMVSLLVVDALTRLVAVAAAVAADAPLWGLTLAVALPAWCWVPFLLVGRRGEVTTIGSRSPAGPFLRRAGSLMAATGMASLLVAGLPWLASTARSTGLTAGDAGTLASLVLLRSPLLALMYGVRPAILRGYALRPDGLHARVRRAWGRYLLGGLGLTAGAGLLGPVLVPRVFGPGFEIGAAVAASLTASAVLIVMATHGGLALVVQDRHRQVLEGWALGVVATVAGVSLPLATQSALASAALLGPLAVLGWQERCLRQSRPSENAVSRSWRE
jgi:O-antigen/teichoic acid export membrane protein